MGTFKIPDIPRYGIVLEENLNNSIFKEVYQGAARSVVEIIKHNQENRTGELFLNSSVVFAGERGSGKSSAMNTFAEFLKNPIGDHPWLDREQYKIISQNKFYVLPSIDATQMGQKETLLGSISAKMFAAFQDMQKKILQPNSKVTLEQQREFVRKAQRVNRVAYMYQTGDWYRDNDELLQNTTSIESLKSEFHELVECFLGLMTDKYDRKNTYLVIAVDDIDMCMEASFSIVDEIRKFLTEKNIIVLTSVYMEQLKKVITQHFSKPLDTKCRMNVMPSSYYAANSLAEKYIQKIFPIARQHRMPRITFEQMSYYTIENIVENTDNEKKYWSDLKIDLSKSSYSPTIMQGILHLVYKKTLLLLLPNEYGRHWIIPQNIRSLVNFVIFLKDMEDVAYVKDADGTFRVATNDELKSRKNIIEKNLNSLMQYIVDDMSSYVTSEVNYEDDALAAVLKQLIRDLPDWSAETINAKIVRDILYHTNGLGPRPRNKKLYSDIFTEMSDALLDASKHSKLVSMGDVLYVLGRVDSKTASWEIKRLVEIVRVIWSIRATKEFFVNGINQSETDSEIDPGKYITRPFRYMVGGFMVNPDCAKFFPYNYGQSQGHNDWIFATFDAAKYVQKYSYQEKDDILDVLNFIYVFQPPADSVRELKKGERILPLTRWRTYDNHEEAYFERRIQTQSNTTIHLALNYMSLFTNMLSTNVLGNNITSRTAEGDSLLIGLAKGWQRKYIMFFPFYSMDYMYCLYNKVHRDSLAKTRQYSDLKKPLNDFLGMFCEQMKGIENSITKEYLNAEPCENAETSLAICCYSKRMESFKNQVNKNNEISLIGKLGDFLNDMNGDIYLREAINNFIEIVDDKAQNESKDNLPTIFSNHVSELHNKLDIYSPNKIKDDLKAIKEISDPQCYKSGVEKMNKIIDDYFNFKTLEAYVY